MNSQVADDNLNIEQDLRNRLQDRWDLSRDPFAAHPDFFFEGGGRRHLLQQLRHLAGFGDRLIWIWGAAGIGKTRLVAEFCRLEQAELDIQILDAGALQSLEALIRQLHGFARQRASAPSAGFSSLAEFFRWSQAAPGRGKRLVLVIDNAEEVPYDVLQGLFDGFAQSDRSLAALPVIAHSTSVEQALTGQLDAGLLACVHEMALPGFNQAEAADFLHAAFKLAGAPTELQLGKRHIDRIFAASKGNPGEIQRRAPAVLLELSSGVMPASKSAKTDEEKSPLTPTVRNKGGIWRWVLIAAFLLVGSFSLIYMEYNGSSTKSARETVELQPQRAMIHDGSAQNPPSTSASKVSHPALLTREAASLTSRPSSKQVMAGTGQGISEATATGAHSLLKSVQQEKPASDSSAPIGNSGAGSVDASPLSKPSSAPVHSTTPIPSPATVHTSAPAHRRATKTVKAGNHASSVPSTPAEHPVTTASKKSSKGFTPARPAKYTPIDTLAKQSGSVVQLSGSYSEKSATELMDRYPAVDMHYTRSEYHGKPWYVIYLGPFKDAQRAHQALRALPKRLRQAGPWVRSASGF